MKWTKSATIHGHSTCRFALGEGVAQSSMRVRALGDGKYRWSVHLYIPGSTVLYKASGSTSATETKARHMAMSAVSAFLQIHDGVKPDEVA